ncbi:hypothetical protein B296_00036998, partial [Ensete ventricosum]
GAALAVLQRAAATYGLATGGCPLRSCRGQQTLAAWPQSFVPAGWCHYRGPSRDHARGREENRRWWLKL